MNKSTRHHFIPKFYLNHFTDDEGKFYIYDVKKGSFRDNSRKFTPKQQFYESFGNTVYYKDGESEFIEEEFAKVDSNVGVILDKITVDKDYELSSEEWMYIQYFVNILYWRIPANVDKVKERIQNASHLRELGIKVMDSTTNERANEQTHTEVLNKAKEDKDFYKFFKLMLPALTYPEIFKKDFSNFAHIITIELPTALPKIVSDNPIIYRNPNNMSLHNDDFIFPLTPTKFLFRHTYKKIKMWSDARLMIDTLLIMQANEYISSTSRAYPIILKQVFLNNYNSLDELREHLFSRIIDGS